MTVDLGLRDMRHSQCCVLVLATPFDDVRGLESSLRRLKCQTVVARSTEQAIANVHQASPCLVILAGQQHRLSMIASQLRNVADFGSATIVALSDFHAPNWAHQEDFGLDGFLVKPMTSDVLTSLVQSAWVRQTCYQAG